MNGRLAAARYQLGAVRLSGVVPRVALLVFGLAAVLLSTPARVLLVLAVASLVLSAAIPERVAAAAPAVVLVAAWMIDDGSTVATPGVRAVAFALAVYLLTSAGALAAAIPADARVDPAVYRRWGRGLLLPGASAVVVGALLSLPGRLPGSSLVDVVGLLGAIGVLVVIVRSVNRR